MARMMTSTQHKSAAPPGTSAVNAPIELLLHFQESRMGSRTRERGRLGLMDFTRVRSGQHSSVTRLT